MSTHAPHIRTGDALDEYVAKYSNWGRWGHDDQVGTANYITPGARVRSGASRPHRPGRVTGDELRSDRPADRRERPLQLSAVLGGHRHRPRIRTQLWSGGPLPREMLRGRQCRAAPPIRNALGQPRPHRPRRDGLQRRPGDERVLLRCRATRAAQGRAADARQKGRSAGARGPRLPFHQRPPGDNLKSILFRHTGWPHGGTLQSEG